MADKFEKFEDEEGKKKLRRTIATTNEEIYDKEDLEYQKTKIETLLAHFKE